MPCNHAVVVSCGLYILLFVGSPALQGCQAAAKQERPGVDAESKHPAADATAEETHVVNGEYFEVHVRSVNFLQFESGVRRAPCATPLVVSIGKFTLAAVVLW